LKLDEQNVGGKNELGFDSLQLLKEDLQDLTIEAQLHQGDQKEISPLAKKLLLNFKAAILGGFAPFQALQGILLLILKQAGQQICQDIHMLLFIDLQNINPEQLAVLQFDQVLLKNRLQTDFPDKFISVLGMVIMLILQFRLTLRLANFVTEEHSIHAA